jgi:hypothetical protein
VSVQLLSLHSESAQAFDSAGHHEFLLFLEIDLVVMNEDSLVRVDDLLWLAAEEFLLFILLGKSIFLSLRDGDLLFLFDLLHVLFSAGYDEHFRLICWLVFVLPRAQVKLAAKGRRWSISLWLVLAAILAVATLAGIPLNTKLSQT